jgi:site-specific recombinase XerD
MTTTPTTEVAVVDPVFSDVEQYALAAFLAGYRGLTRDAYALDLRQFIVWCEQHKLRLFEARRADIECFARDLEDRGRARATVTRRLCTVAGFYRYAEQEGLLERSPAADVRRPRLDYESHATGLDRNEVGALLVAAGLASARDHALVSLLAINGLRVSEALGADTEALGIVRGHRTLTVLRKGGKVVIIPLAPRTARAIDLAIGERIEGPIFLGRNGDRLSPRRVADRATAGPKGRDQQAGRAAHPSSRLHHRRPRRRRASPRRARGSQPCRSPYNDAL